MKARLTRSTDLIFGCNLCSRISWVAWVADRFTFELGTGTIKPYITDTMELCLISFVVEPRTSRANGT